METAGERAAVPGTGAAFVERSVTTVADRSVVDEVRLFGDMHRSPHSSRAARAVGGARRHRSVRGAVQPGRGLMEPRTSGAHRTAAVRSLRRAWVQPAL
ncbi:hypothetical protein ACFPH6_36115, partial [Streptomyces xiangluensis]